MIVNLQRRKGGFAWWCTVKIMTVRCKVHVNLRWGNIWGGIDYLEGGWNSNTTSINKLELIVIWCVAILWGRGVPKNSRWIGIIAIKLVGIYLFFCTLADYTMNGINNNQQGHQTTCNGGVGDNIWHCGGWFWLHKLHNNLSKLRCMWIHLLLYYYAWGMNRNKYNNTQ